MQSVLKDIDLAALNQQFAGRPAEEILSWSVATFSDNAAVTTSFQASGIALIHMLKAIEPSFPIFFIDTGYHFPETLAFKERLTRDWDLNVVTLTPAFSKEDQDHRYGRHLYERDPELCCKINKVDPFLQLRRTSGKRTWISALRSDQSRSRTHYTTVMSDNDGCLRIHPMIYWTKADLWRYIQKHSLPFHPLYDQGYASIGCFPVCCTSKTTNSQHERKGRWNGSEKQECGLHLNLNGSTNSNCNEQFIEVSSENEQ